MLSGGLTRKRERSWLGQAVFALDRWLCRCQGIYEFSRRADCLFRIEDGTADRNIVLSDGARARAGDPVLKLHLWSEHMPPMGRRGPTVGWARHASRALDSSMRELANHLARRSDLANVRVLYGDMRLATYRQTEQFKRIIARYGFETAPPDPKAQGILHRVGDTILVLLLVLATNPIALRRALLRRYHKRVYLSRVALEDWHDRRVRRARPRGWIDR
jgi:hypothetical protein